MRKAFLKKMRDALTTQKQQILEQLDEEFRKGKESALDEGMDTYDLASEERTREINLILSDRDREKLQAIEDALERIDAGTYGICEMCEEEIAPERLEALPFTRLCVTCQSEIEKEAKLHRRPEEDRTHRRASLVDLDEENS
ncbi:MAG: TraR/DksA family transcriptional regulator [Thermodesulfobacteriota bacterium]|jgi:DnaK suppressor protein